jgi:hypothetical protein
VNVRWIISELDKLCFFHEKYGYETESDEALNELKIKEKKSYQKSLVISNYICGRM